MNKTLKVIANVTTANVPVAAKGPDSAVLASAKSIVGTMTKGEAAERTAMQAAHERAGLSTKQAILKMLGGRNSAVSEAEWKRVYAPAFVAALNEAYSDGYGPRLSHIRVMLIGISNGIEGPAGRRQYYEAVLPTLYDKGLLAKGKAGRPASTVGGAVTSGKAVDASKEVKGADTDAAPDAPTFQPGKKFAQADLMNAALLLFGSPDFAGKLLKVRADAGMTDQLKKAVNAMLAG